MGGPNLPFSHSKKYLLSTYYVLLTMSLGYTVKSIQQGPCSHELYVLEREIDREHRKNLSGSEESDGGHKTGPGDGK